MNKNYDEIQNNDFDTLLRLMLKFNCLIQQDDICDVIDCSYCPFGHLSPETEYGDVDTTACTTAMANKLEELRKGID
jgi:hypothetical protein